MAVPGVSVATSALSKGAQAATKASSQVASKASSAATKASSAAVSKTSAATSKVSQAASKTSSQALSTTRKALGGQERIKAAAKRHLETNRKSSGEPGAPGDRGPIDKAIGKQTDVMQAAIDNPGQFSSPVKALGGKKKIAEAKREREAEEAKSEKERVKVFDSVPGTRGDADTSYGRAKRQIIESGLKNAARTAGGSAGMVADRARRSKVGKFAEDKAKKAVPKPIRKVGGQVVRDGKRVAKEAASEAVDGFLKGGKVGAITGGAKGLIRGAVQSKTFWVFMGLQGAGLAILSCVVALALVIASAFAQELASSWKYKAAMTAADVVSTVDGWHKKAQEAAENVVDGAEWVIGAGVQYHNGLVDKAGSVRDNTVKDGIQMPESEEDESGSEETESEEQSGSEADVQNNGWPSFGDPPANWQTGDAVMLTDISEVVVDYDDGGYSVNGMSIDLVRMNAEADPVEGYTDKLHIDVDTLADANVFIAGKTKPLLDTDPFSADNLGTVPDIEMPEPNPTPGENPQPSPSDEPEPEPSDEPEPEPSEDEEPPSNEDESQDDAEDSGNSEDEGSSEDEDSTEDEDDPRGESAKKWNIDVDRAKELGLDDDDLGDYTDGQWLQFITQQVSDEIRRLSAERNITVSMSSGASMTDEGIGFVSNNYAASYKAEQTKEVYTEAIKTLPIEDIESKAGDIFTDARQWWYGQICAPEGSTPGDSGNFTGDGIPERAIPWIENAYKHSKTKIPKAFFAYIMDRETDFRPDLYASDINGGTQGLFQMNRKVWAAATDGGTWDDPDITDPMIHTEYGAQYFDERLETVRTMRKKNPDKPYATDLTELEALMIAHNSGELNLSRYPNVPGITRGYLKEFREKFEDYGGGEPGQGGGGSSEASGKLVKPQGNFPKTSDRGHRWGRFHAGTDYGTPLGTELPAMFDGEVTFSGWMGGYGNIIIVKGNWDGQELGYAYAHMNERKVTVGQKVTAGDLIGISGNTGVGTGPHLHLELRTSGFSDPGREYNTADAHKFLESNGAEILDGTTSPVPTPDATDTCPEIDSMSTPGGDLSGEGCEANEKLLDGLTDATGRVYKVVCANFPEVKHYGGRRYSSAIGNRSDHYTGKAVDVMINHSGSNDKELGDKIFEFVLDNREELDIKYLIWQQAYYGPSTGWNRKPMEDRGNETQNHFDHIHISVNN